MWSKERREIDATDTHVGIVDDGSIAAISFHTTIETDLTLVLARDVLKRLRSQIDEALTRTTPSR